MKIRRQFISNSSSTSYTCEICKNTEASSDCVGINDFGFVSCEHGHTFCTSHVEKATQYWDEEYGEYKIYEKDCPLCKLDEISDYDLLQYLLWKNQTSKSELVKKLKSKYHTVWFMKKEILK